MTVLKGLRGSWINQFALPDMDTFIGRAAQVDYVIIKYGFSDYEKVATLHGNPWLAERMAEPVGPAAALLYATQLAAQATQPGCIGAVINLEEADGGWDKDDGYATRRLIGLFRSQAPGVPLFASLDTRGNRPNSPYQQVCAELCDGVMPMVYPGAFGLPADQAFVSALTPLLLTRWAGKDVIPTIQTYSPPDVDVHAEVDVLTYIYAAGKIHGANTYTLGHATDAQWDASLLFKPGGVQTVPIPPDIAAALIAIREMWSQQWTAIAERGNVPEATALLSYWQRLVGQA